MKVSQPDYKLIYTDIINKKYPHKIENCKALLSVRYNDLFAPLVKTIQQQQAIIAKLKKRLQELEKR